MAPRRHTTVGGIRFRRPRFRFGPATSDADFLIEFDPESNLPPPQQFFGLAEALETLLQRPVDLVERGAIDYPFLVADIARAHEVVYAG